MDNLMKTPDTDTQMARRKRMENRAWFDARIDDLIKQYPGKPIAVQNGHVISEGNTESEVLTIAREKARQKGWMEEELLFIRVPSREVVKIQYPGGES